MPSMPTPERYPRYVPLWVGASGTRGSVLLGWLVALGCDPLGAFKTQPAAPSAIPVLDDGQARCKVAASQENPLVTEWPASEKANLEARLAQGAVVVSYSGCALKILPSCRAPGGYAWRRTTTSTDVIEIRSADDLYAKLPLGAVSLEGELRQSGRLAVQTTVAGQMQLARFDTRGLKGDTSCTGATHVVGALSVGAFKLRSGGATSSTAGVEVASVGSTGAHVERDESVLREAGNPSRCEESTPEAPHGECGSPIQIFLRPLPNSVVDRGPPGTVKVRFWPVYPDEEWDLVVGDRLVCPTPCERWVDPAMPYALRHDPGMWRRNSYVELPDLRKYASMERMEVRVIPRATGEFVVGIVATSIGGTAAAVGTVLVATDCGDGGGGCVGGLVTLPLGLAATGGGVWMIVDSAGEIKVNPAGEAAMSGASLPWREPKP